MVIDEEAINIDSGIPPLGTICSACHKPCPDEKGVYAYSGQITPKPFCSGCRSAAIDYAIMEKKNWLRTYSTGSGCIDVSNWSRKKR